jgi:hypothetical protein
MEILAALGGGAFILASLGVSIRLLLLSFRTRKLPEIAMGLGLMLLGGIAYPVIVVARVASELPDGLRGALGFIYMLSMLLGIFALAFFNWRVFRPESSRALLAVLAIGAGMAISLVGQGVFGSGYLEVATGITSPWMRAQLFLPASALGWASVESLRYHLLLRRRLALGLADPLVADRFRLWAIGTGAAMLLNAASSTTTAMGYDMSTTAAGALMITALGLVAAGSTWFAFVPSPAYARWVRAKAKLSEA